MRRRHEDVEEAEEARAVADVQDGTVEEGIELGVKVGVFAVRGRASASYSSLFGRPTTKLPGLCERGKETEISGLTGRAFE